jgi:cytochrome c oxidase assembly protein subunit 15
MTEQTKKQLVIWLLSGCFFIFSMVVVGGITRLTGSGLSITEWKVVTGTIPPLNQQQWQEAFDKYKLTPQFQKLNYNFSLSDFKNIFFWEYLHRLIGRLIGVVFLIPFVYFLWTKKLTDEWIKKSLLLFVLGGLQGFIGWYMVQSGLIERTSVSHYRLAIHLIIAFITFGAALWLVLQLMVGNMLNHHGRSSLLPNWILVFVMLQIIYGAFVAGLHAGKIANTFPTMDGEWIPSGIFAMSPIWLNFFENVLTVQFIHRFLAFIIVICVTILWIQSRKNIFSVQQKRAASFCLFAVTIQFLLGIFTLLYKVSITLAMLHQIGGFFLFSSIIVAMFFFQFSEKYQTAT